MKERGRGARMTIASRGNVIPTRVYFLLLPAQRLIGGGCSPRPNNSAKLPDDGGGCAPRAHRRGGENARAEINRALCERMKYTGSGSKWRKCTLARGTHYSRTSCDAIAGGLRASVRARPNKVRVCRVIRARRNPPRDLQPTKVRRRLVDRGVGGLFFKGGVFSNGGGGSGGGGGGGVASGWRVTGMRVTDGTRSAHRSTRRRVHQGVPGRETRDPETIACGRAFSEPVCATMTLNAFLSRPENAVYDDDVD